MKTSTNPAFIPFERDRQFRAKPKIGHVRPESPVTFVRNPRSRSSGNPGHLRPEYACESGFEQQVFNELSSRGYRVVPQVKTGAYRIDMVVEGGADTRLAIECDGDEFHGPDRWQHDMQRQRVLERAGWVFWRCFASTWALRKDEVLEELLDRLMVMGIAPLGAIDRVPSLVEKRVWDYKEHDNGNTEAELALEVAISSAKSS